MGVSTSKFGIKGKQLYDTCGGYTYKLSNDILALKDPHFFLHILVQVTNYLYSVADPGKSQGKEGIFDQL